MHSFYLLRSPWDPIKGCYTYWSCEAHGKPTSGKIPEAIWGEGEFLHGPRPHHIQSTRNENIRVLTLFSSRPMPVIASPITVIASGSAAISCQQRQSLLCTDTILCHFDIVSSCRASHGPPRNDRRILYSQFENGTPLMLRTDHPGTLLANSPSHENHYDYRWITHRWRNIRYL